MYWRRKQKTFVDTGTPFKKADFISFFLFFFDISMSQIFTKCGDSKMEGNTRNSYIGLSIHQKADQLTLGLTAKDERRRMGLGLAK